MKKSLEKWLIVFLSISFTSLFADITYEGARSILGPFLEYVGASIIIVGFIGIAEFFGYLTRYLSGLIVTYLKSNKVFWFLVYLGYILNLFAIPLLAFANYWEIALILIFLERIGKGLRTPLRDVLISEVTEKIGKGKGFGIHEFLDQIGAILGPLIISLSLFFTKSYSFSFLILIIPALTSIIFLYIANINYKEIKTIGSKSNEVKLSKVFWIYCLSMNFLMLGFIHWSLISFHLIKIGIPEYLIALMYLVAMISDAIFAIPIGILYDKFKLKSLIISPFFVIFSIPILLLTDTIILIIFGSLLWGSVLSITETIMRAAIGDIVEYNKRAYAYGIFGLFLGSFWMIGSLIFSLLYSIGMPYVISFILITEIISFFLLIKTINIYTNFILWKKP